MARQLSELALRISTLERPNKRSLYSVTIPSSEKEAKSVAPSSPRNVSPAPPTGLRNNTNQITPSDQKRATTPLLTSFSLHEDFKITHFLENYLRFSLQKRDLYIRYIQPLKGHLTIKISLDSTGPFSLWLLHTCYLVLGPKDYRFSVVDEPLDLGTMINVKTLVENVRFNCTSKFLLRDEHIDISINKNIPLRIDKDGLRYGTLIVDPIDGVKAE